MITCARFLLRLRATAEAQRQNGTLASTHLMRDAQLQAMPPKNPNFPEFKKKSIPQSKKKYLNFPTSPKTIYHSSKLHKRAQLKRKNIHIRDYAVCNVIEKMVLQPHSISTRRPATRPFIVIFKPLPVLGIR